MTECWLAKARRGQGSLLGLSKALKYGLAKKVALHQVNAGVDKEITFSGGLDAFGHQKNA
jgi:hypothetical protein